MSVVCIGHGYLSASTITEPIMVWDFAAFTSRLFLLMDHFQFFSLAAVVSSFLVFLYISGGSLLYFHDMFHFAACLRFACYL